MSYDRSMIEGDLGQDVIVTFPSHDGRYRWHLMQGGAVLAAGRRGWWTQAEAEEDAARAQNAMAHAQFG